METLSGRRIVRKQDTADFVPVRSYSRICPAFYTHKSEPKWLEFVTRVDGQKGENNGSLPLEHPARFSTLPTRMDNNSPLPSTPPSTMPPPTMSPSATLHGKEVGKKVPGVIDWAKKYPKIVRPSSKLSVETPSKTVPPRTISSPLPSTEVHPPCPPSTMSPILMPRVDMPQIAANIQRSSQISSKTSGFKRSNLWNYSSSDDVPQKKKRKLSSVPQEVHIPPSPKPTGFNHSKPRSKSSISASPLTKPTTPSGSSQMPDMPMLLEDVPTPPEPSPKSTCFEHGDSRKSSGDGAPKESLFPAPHLEKTTPPSGGPQVPPPSKPHSKSTGSKDGDPRSSTSSDGSPNKSSAFSLTKSTPPSGVLQTANMPQLSVDVPPPSPAIPAIPSSKASQSATLHGKTVEKTVEGVIDWAKKYPKKTPPETLMRKSSSGYGAQWKSSDPPLKKPTRSNQRSSSFGDVAPRKSSAPPQIKPTPPRGMPQLPADIPAPPQPKTSGFKRSNQQSSSFSDGAPRKSSDPLLKKPTPPSSISLLPADLPKPSQPKTSGFKRSNQRSSSFGDGAPRKSSAPPLTKPPPPMPPPKLSPASPTRSMTPSSSRQSATLHGQKAGKTVPGVIDWAKKYPKIAKPPPKMPVNKQPMKLTSPSERPNKVHVPPPPEPKTSGFKPSNQRSFSSGSPHLAKPTPPNGRPGMPHEVHNRPLPHQPSPKETVEIPDRIFQKTDYDSRTEETAAEVPDWIQKFDSQVDLGSWLQFN